MKNVSTCFVGTSPEFELALYTLAIHSGEERNRVNLAGVDVELTTFWIAGNKVGSAFPKVIE